MVLLMSLIKGNHRLTIECLSNLSLRFLPEGGTKKSDKSCPYRGPAFGRLVDRDLLNLRELVNKSMSETQVVLENGETYSKKL